MNGTLGPIRSASIIHPRNVSDSGRELGHRSLSCAPHLVLVDHLSHPDESSEIRGVDGKGGVLGNGLM